MALYEYKSYLKEFADREGFLMGADGNIEGILIPMATAFNEDGSIDEEGTDALVDFNLASLKAVE